jgi:hypothetical protein
MKSVMKGLIAFVLLCASVQVSRVCIAGGGGNKECVPGYWVPPAAGEDLNVECIPDGNKCNDVNCDTIDRRIAIWIAGFCDTGITQCTEMPVNFCQTPAYVGFCSRIGQNCDCQYQVTAGIQQGNCPDCT